MNSNLEKKKIIAKNWFKNLRNSICDEFEKIEYLKSKKRIFFKKKNGLLVEVLKVEERFR
jgi:coproporphyrinogen III oxidase